MPASRENPSPNGAYPRMVHFRVNTSSPLTVSTSSYPSAEASNSCHLEGSPR